MGAQIRLRRIGLLMSAREAAREADISVTAWLDLEDAKHAPTMKTQRGVAYALDWPFDWCAIMAAGRIPTPVTERTVETTPAAPADVVDSGARASGPIAPLGATRPSPNRYVSTFLTNELAHHAKQVVQMLEAMEQGRWTPTDGTARRDSHWFASAFGALSARAEMLATAAQQLIADMDRSSDVGRSA